MPVVVRVSCPPTTLSPFSTKNSPPRFRQLSTRKGAWLPRSFTLSTVLVSSPQDVVTVDPNPLAIAHGPVSGFPDIIIAADVITGATRIVWPILNRYRDRSI